MLNEAPFIAFVLKEAEHNGKIFIVDSGEGNDCIDAETGWYVEDLSGWYINPTDKEWDDIINIGMMDSVDLPDPKYDVWRCPKCERIYVFEKNRVIKYYVLHSIDELTAD